MNLSRAGAAGMAVLVFVLLAGSPAATSAQSKAGAVGFGMGIEGPQGEEAWPFALRLATFRWWMTESIALQPGLIWTRVADKPQGSDDWNSNWTINPGVGLLFAVAESDNVRFEIGFGIGAVYGESEHQTTDYSYSENCDSSGCEGETVTGTEVQTIIGGAVGVGFAVEYWMTRNMSLSVGAQSDWFSVFASGTEDQDGTWPVHIESNIDTTKLMVGLFVYLD